jgi:hypothetical protein
MYSTKKCSCCQSEKNVSCFAFKNKKLGKLHSMCKECRSEYSSNHYNNNKKKYLERARKNNVKYIGRNKDFIREYKATHGCKFCNEKNPVCLDFHHEDPRHKEANISRMKNDSHSIQKIKQEISKCIVVCANCHRKLHYG